MELGQILVQLRTEKQGYQKELAAHLKVSIGTISNYEKGLHEPDLNNLSMIADYYGVSTDFLLGRTGYRHPLDALELPLTDHYTFTDMLNTSVEFSDEGKRELRNFMAYLEYKEAALKKNQNTTKKHNK